MEDAKMIDAPIATTTKLCLEGTDIIVEQKLYRGMIEYLLHLISRGPDIVFSMGLCAIF